MKTEPLVRVTVHVNRKPGTTEEEFHQYWVHKHGPLALDWLTRNGILKYTQYHTPSDWKAKGAKMSEATGRPMFGYDGSGDFYVKKYEDFEAAFLDPYYQEVIRPDELKLIDPETVSVTIGYEYCVIEDGIKIETHDRVVQNNEI